MPCQQLSKSTNAYNLHSQAPSQNACQRHTWDRLQPLAACADARQALLDAIKGKKGDEEVISALRELAKQNPTSAPARSEKIFGEWNLLWASANAEVGSWPL